MIGGTIGSEYLALFFENHFLELLLLFVELVHFPIVVDFWILCENLSGIGDIVFILAKFNLLDAILTSFTI